MALALLATFWVLVAFFLLLAPDHLFKSGKKSTRTYGAIGALVFAAFCVVAALA
jgi:tetrahydromethanopterin S-methyltransferase subunit F